MLAIDHITAFAHLVKRLQGDGIDCIHSNDYTVRVREARPGTGLNPVEIEHEPCSVVVPRDPGSDWGWHLWPLAPNEPHIALGPLTYENLRDILLSLTATRGNRPAILEALSRLAVSANAEQRHLAQVHPLYLKVEETLRVQSALLGATR